MPIEMISTEEFHAGTRIKVLGVGGGGGNAVQHMIDRNVEGVEFVSPIPTHRHSAIAAHTAPSSLAAQVWAQAASPIKGAMRQKQPLTKYAMCSMAPTWYLSPQAWAAAQAQAQPPLLHGLRVKWASSP